MEYYGTRAGTRVAPSAPEVTLDELLSLSEDARWEMLFRGEKLRPMATDRPARILAFALQHGVVGRSRLEAALCLTPRMGLASADNAGPVSSEHQRVLATILAALFSIRDLMEALLLPRDDLVRLVEGFDFGAVFKGLAHPVLYFCVVDALLAQTIPQNSVQLTPLGQVALGCLA